MSSRKLREKRNCLNCDRYVEDRFCSHCGQENTINRPSFFYLFTTFFKDLVNYDSNFWQTISTLFLKPGVIVNQYLAGRRTSFVSPIKLYFFISLFTFLLPSILIDFNDDEDLVLTESTSKKKDIFHIDFSEDSKPIHVSDSVQGATSLQEVKNDSIDKDSEEYDIPDNRLLSFGEHSLYSKANTRKEFDSIHNSLSKEDKMSWIVKPLYRKNIELAEKGLTFDGQFQEVFTNAFRRNFPRVLILYLPLFAFVLWIFHGKKQWKYYDHGVFTLYFFSFLLLLTSVIMLFDWINSITQNFLSILGSVTNSIGVVLYSACFFYAFYYFFKSHRKIYKENKSVSRLKSFFIFGINFFLFTISLLMYTAITFLMI